MSLTSCNVNKDFGGYWNFQNAPFQFGAPIANGAPQTTALMFGGGTSTYPLTDSSITGKSFIEFWFKNVDTSDLSSRGLRINATAAGVGGGVEAIRGKAFGSAAGLNAIRGGSFAVELDTTAANQITGAGYGLEASFNALAATRVMTGTIAALNLQSFIAAGNTVPASHSFIRLSDVGAVGFTNLLDLSAFTEGTTSSSVLCTTSTDDTSTHRIKIRGPAGTVMWLMATTTSPH